MEQRLESYSLGVCRTGGIGDAIVSAGAIKSINHLYPNSKLTAYVYGSVYTIFQKFHIRCEEVQVHNRNGQAGFEIYNRFKDKCDIWFDLKPVPKVYFKDESLYTDTIKYWDDKLEPLHLGYIESCQGLGALNISQQDLLSVSLGIDCCPPVTGFERGKTNGYVTLCNEAWGQCPIKTWYPERWLEVVDYLNKLGYVVHQIGEEYGETIGDCINQTGKLVFREACSLVAGADFHLGIEGFWNHFCAGTDIPSIIIFGPTPKSFFGYCKNNLSGECGNCWWTTNDWMLNCPKGYPVNDRPCMNSISVSDVITEINNLVI
jgi:ADP-heptose:LPS heptosyltransferase